MSRHYEDAEGLCENIDEETQSYFLIKLCLGLKIQVFIRFLYSHYRNEVIYKKSTFLICKFTLYFLAMPKECK